MMAGTRSLTAGAVLMAWAALTRQRLKPTRSELITLVLAALLLWVTGNGLITWGEQHADSSVTALIVASVPVWAAVIGAVWERRLPSWLLVASLLTSSAGLVVLSIPVLLSGVRAELVAVAGLVLASLSWALGTVVQSKRRVSLAPLASSAYQMLFGAVGFGLVALLAGEPLPRPVPEAWLAWGYLVVFGSLIGFTSFIRALHLLPANLVTTYAFVNPIIAVFLGWLFLHEPVTHWTTAGAVLVLLGVMGVFWANVKKQAGRQAEAANGPSALKPAQEGNSQDPNGGNMEQDAELPETKTELIERIRSARRQLETALERLTPAQLTMPGPEGWSIKDHLLHIASWQQILLGIMHGKAGHGTLGVEAEVFATLDIDEVNALLYERERQRSLEDAWRYFRDTFSAVLRELESIPEEALKRPYRVSASGETRPLLEAIVNNSYDHDLEHLEWIRRDFLSG